MMRCECLARLGRGWRFCETCGRPAAEPKPVTTGEDPGGVLSEASAGEATAGPGSAAQEPPTPLRAAPPTAVPRTEAQSLDHLDWRFGLAPVLIGVLLGLPLAWLSAWVVPVGAVLGALWAWRRWVIIRRAITAFTLDWIFEKVIVFGPCALGERAWWPTGVLYLTDQTLKFKPFNHTNEREVSLDPVRLTRVDFPQIRSWPSDWGCLLPTSTYGPVFGIMKVFDRNLWAQHLTLAKQRAPMPVTQELA